jgi:hypothetical protein
MRDVETLTLNNELALVPLLCPVIYIPCGALISVIVGNKTGKIAFNAQREH